MMIVVVVNAQPARTVASPLTPECPREMADVRSACRRSVFVSA